MISRSRRGSDSRFQDQPWTGRAFSTHDLASESRLMDSLTPASAVAVPPAIPDRPPRGLEILGHDAVGPVHLRRDVPRPGRGHRLLCAAAGQVVRCRRSDPCRRRRSDDLALGHPGTAGRAAGDMGRDPSDADTVCRLSGAALDLMAQFLRRRRGAGHPRRRLGPAVARARARGDAGLHGRGAEIRAGRRRAVAAGDRVLRRRADVGRDILARVSSIAAGRNRSSASPAPSSCRRWPGPRCICSTTGSSSARCFRSACCSAICVTAPTRPG